MNSVLKQYRNQFKTDEILLQLKMILELFQEPLLQLFTNVSNFVLGNKGNAPQLVIGFRLLNLMSNIFFSLNFVDIPEFFEDHMNEWMGLFLIYLEYETDETALLEHEEDDEKPGLLHKLQGSICECLNLYIDKYDVEFEKFLGGFAGAIWKLLTKVFRNLNDTDGMFSFLFLFVA
jgi:exportin-2 (importin alpha re-exporter)